MKKHLLRTMLLIVTMLTGGTNIWADEWSIDFSAIGQKYSDMTQVTISETAAVIDRTTMGTCTVGEDVLDSHFVLQTGTTWYMRGANGLFQATRDARAMGILNCTAGQTIAIVCTGNPEAASSNVSLIRQVGNTYYYGVNMDGNVRFMPPGYLYISSIRVSDSQLFNYSVDAADSSTGYVIQNGIARGAAFDGDLVTFAYCKYILSDGTLYKTDPTGSGYTSSFTVTESNTFIPIWYEATDITNVVYYSEGEKIYGTTQYVGDNTATSSSNAATGISTKGTLPLITLPAGTYQIVSCVYTNSRGTYTFPYLAGTETVFEQTIQGATNATETTSEPFTLTEETTIYLGQVTTEGCGVDYVYIIETDNAGASETDLTADMFYEWSGPGPDAKQVRSAYIDFNLGTELGSAAVVCGTPGVSYIVYADLTGYSKLVAEGTTGTTLRVLMNRVSDGGDTTERQITIDDSGKAELDLTQFSYVHLNAIKIGWGSSGTITALKLVSANDPLAAAKEALSTEIDKAKGISSIGKNAYDFANLTNAIAEAENILASDKSTEEMLTNMKTTLVSLMSNLRMLPGYSVLTKDMFLTWESHEATEGTLNPYICAYELNTPTQMVYGDASVGWLNYANLSEYNQLIVVAPTGAPRFCFNRTADGGQDNDDESLSEMIDIPNNSRSTAAYETVDGTAFTIDLATMTANKGFAHLHSIKGAYWNDVNVTEMLLYKVGPMLPTPDFGYNYYEGENVYYVNFDTYQYIDGDYVDLTIHYSINGGAYQIYSGGKGDNIILPFGATFSFYSSAEGFLDSPVTTTTVTAPIWQTMVWLDGYDTYLYRDDDVAIALHDDGPIDGFRWMMEESTGDLVSNFLATPNDNINENFKLGNRGLVSAEERTYAFSGLTAGQVLVFNVNNDEEKQPDRARLKDMAKKKGPRRIITGNATPLVMAIEGLELDDWNSWDNGMDPDLFYYFRVTTSGTVKFKVAAGAGIIDINVMGENPPYMPEFILTAIDGANRTYEINKPVNATTLYYTTTLADTAPDKGDAAYSSTTAGSVEVTVTGVGNLYAYAENTAGTSDIIMQAVNGIVQTLNPPYIYSKYKSGNLWKIVLASDQSNLDGSPSSTIYYRIDEGEMTAYTGQFTIPDGSTLSFWAEAENYINSPVLTVTATQPLDLVESWSEEYTYIGNYVITLGNEVETGLYQLNYNGSIIRDGRLLTPNENINNSFELTQYSGIYSYPERTYAVSGLTAGQYLRVESYQTVKPLQGLELDPWNSTSRYKMLKVTTDGTVKFAMVTDSYLYSIALMTEPVPNSPTLEVTAANGAERTVTITKPTDATTLYYTTAVANEDPGKDSGTYSSTTDQQVNVVVTGQGYIYAYATNSAGPSETDSIYVNGILQTLNAPYISYKYLSGEQWYVELYCSQYGLEGNPEWTIYYKIDDGELTPYSEGFYMNDGATLSMCAKADGFADSPMVTATSISLPSLNQQWYESYTYSYGSGPITLGEEVETGLFKMQRNGSDIAQGHLLTPNENINDEFRTEYYSGIYTAVDRTYALKDVRLGQYVLVYYNNGGISALQGAVADLWNSGNGNVYLKVTEPGTMKFRAQAGTYITSLYLYQMPEYGDVVVDDANGNKLTYHYDSADSPATFKGISSYSTDAEKAGHIIIADKVTDLLGNEHIVTAIGNSPSNRSKIKSVVFGKNITTLGQNAFNNCDSLLTLDIPETITELGTYCFAYCDNLTSIRFAENSNITTIPNYAFYDCENLAEIEFGKNLTSIYNSWYVFGSSYKLEKLVFPGVQYPFQMDYSLPSNVIIFVHPDMYEEYTGNDFTKDYRIVKIGDTTTFAVTTEADKRLNAVISTTDATKAMELTITGPINGTDVKYLHESFPVLQKLNLKNAWIVEGGDNYPRYDVSDNGTATPNTWSGTWATANNVVGDYMFYNMPMLKHITLPDGVVTIGEYALSGYNGNQHLQRVDMPEGLTTIGNYAFYYNQAMVQADIPSTVTSIGESAFYYCQKLNSVTIPAGVTAIEQYTFYDCDGLTTVTLPENLTRIGYRAFYDCDNLSDIALSAKLETIGNDAFCSCEKLATAFSFPATLKTIGNNAFYNCQLIPSVTFAEGLETVGNGAFYQCNHIEEAVLPQSLTSLGEQAFKYCRKLREFTFPANIKEVPQYVLQGCDSLHKVTLAEGTTKIYYGAFDDCYKLDDINLNQNTLTSIGGYAFSNTGFTTITVPENVTTVDYYAFSDCKKLVTATLPNGITSLGSSTFAGCTLLESVNVPTSISKVPDSFCYNCQKLTSVTMHNGINNIGQSAFYACYELTSIELNDNITTIDYGAFSECRKLELAALPASLTTIGSYAFQNTYAMKSNLVLPEGFKKLDSYAFNESGITGITIPEGLTSFSTYVFYNCSSLASVSLPADLKKIPNYTFYGTTALQNIELPAGLTEIGSQAFYQSGITGINIPKTVTTIGSAAFRYSKLKELKIPNKTTSVGSYVAANCSELETAWLGRNMNYASNSQFDYFYESNNLKLLRVGSGTPPKTPTYSLYSYMGYRTNCVLEVPNDEDVINTYKTTNVWKDFKDIVGYMTADKLNELDYKVMIAMYNRLDGANWNTTKKWNLSNNQHSNGKWLGVTTVKDENADEDDDELIYYITGISLIDLNLQGELPDSVFMLPQLQTLELSQNNISGDLGHLLDNVTDEQLSPLTTVRLKANKLQGDLTPFAQRLTNVTKLDVSCNQLTGMSEPVAHDNLTNSNFMRGYQFINYYTKAVEVPEDMQEEVVINFTPGVPVDVRSTNYQLYRHDYGDFNRTFSSMRRFYNSGGSLSTTTELQKNSEGLFDLYEGSYVFKAPKDSLIAYTHGYDGITYIFRINWKDGDVNADQTVDVTDLQSIIYWIMNNDSQPIGQKYNFSAADANSDNKLNVLDVVGNVNRILAYNASNDEEPAAARARENNKENNRNRMDITSHNLLMNNVDAVAALQLTISGVTRAQIDVNSDILSRFSMKMADVDGGVKIVIYSPEGRVIAPGTHELLFGLPASAIITDARLSDSNARHLNVNYEGVVTSIDELSISESEFNDAKIYDLSGRRVGKWHSLPAGIYVVNVNGKQFKVRK